MVCKFLIAMTLDMRSGPVLGAPKTMVRPNASPVYQVLGGSPPLDPWEEYSHADSNAFTTLPPSATYDCQTHRSTSKRRAWKRAAEHESQHSDWGRLRCDSWHSDGSHEEGAGKELFYSMDAAQDEDAGRVNSGLVSLVSRERAASRASEHKQSGDGRDSAGDEWDDSEWGSPPPLLGGKARALARAKVFLEHGHLDWGRHKFHSRNIQVDEFRTDKTIMSGKQRALRRAKLAVAEINNSAGKAPRADFPGGEDLEVCGKSRACNEDGISGGDAPKHGWLWGHVTGLLQFHK